MPTVTHENIDELNAILTVVISQNDYFPKVNSKLKEYRQKAQIKGFRPGKVPMGLIKRKFGTALLAEELNTQINEQLNDYIKEQKLGILGQPLEMEEEKTALNINKAQDYTFKFELGLAPEFEVQGMSTENRLPFYGIIVEDEVVEETIENIRKKHSTGFEEGVTDVEEGDMLVISLEELDENGELKENGVVKEETFLAIRDIVNEELKDNLLTATLLILIFIP